jgi:uncharacterized protein
MKKEKSGKYQKLMSTCRFVGMKWIQFFLVLILGTYQGFGQYVRYTYPDGTVSSEGTMRDGKPDGYWKTYYPNGSLKSEGNRVEFKLDSVWIFYRSDTTKERMITYQADVRQGKEIIYDKAGRKTEEWKNELGIKKGIVYYYYDTGALWKEIQFENNKEEGKGIEYDHSGRIISNYIFKNGFIYQHERINRYNEVGNKTGIWRELYDDQQIKLEGNYNNGKKNGVFKFYDRKGKLEKLEQYEDDVLIEGEQSVALPDIRQEYYADGQLRASGSYRNGKKHGTFRIYDPRGMERISELYEQDQKMGEGALDSLGRRNGTWKLFYADGRIKAEGSYKLGLKEGSWTYYFGNGKPVQTGSYINDLPVGNWKWYYNSGQLHRDEYYLRGKEDGHCVEYDSIGVVLTEGDYSGGRKIGTWILHVNDHKEEGSYEDGELNGVWIWSYVDGSKAFEGEYAVGVPVGKHRYWYPNGQLRMKGEYAGGELSGRWDYYEADGTLTLQLEYEAGKVIRVNGSKIKLPDNPE